MFKTNMCNYCNELKTLSEIQVLQFLIPGLKNKNTQENTGEYLLESTASAVPLRSTVHVLLPRR